MESLLDVTPLSAETDKQGTQSIPQAFSHFENGHLVFWITVVQ